ncbi:TrkH family potassium uptake protein [Flavilitoribacter nigricans]|uniref:Potassium transporter KtrB n=1 Tax=Flavilitoribacter nigricans (strain ATCC 23147 / DSM 23189 / NBRC 102662 / NCIMB 1420 / SS-2) TaxID=1122177 RepID=A0A2D0N1Y6_FLAN2|nr:potassium transporter TrkG [Flavilitoribacter nigricans]PHN02139.1 potassium transporter KtrB [Flavilitoribacter nigricans DSM 23189 = NBRC 102662]
MTALNKLILGYVCIVLVGFGLLSFPVFHLRAGSWVNDLFFAVSAASTTGLVPADIHEVYNFGGQVILLLLIQIGGIGYMSVGALALLLVQHHWNPEETTLIKTDLALPHHYNLLDLLKVKLLLSLVLEITGAVMLYFAFRSRGVDDALWQAVFHSVSAFCTAGMSLFSNGLEDFADDPVISITISVLCYVGAVGFIVFADLWQRLRKKRRSISFTSLIILKYSLLIIGIGTISVYLLDYAAYPAWSWQRFITAFFHVVSASSTAGFDTVQVSSFSPAILVILTILMVIGASPTGTGGGIKVTTFSIVLAQIRSSFNGRNKVVLEKCLLPDYRVRLALATFSTYIIAVSVCLLLLAVTEKADLFALFFETVSAFSTVGLSLGITSGLSDIGKLLLALGMFIGRIGILSFGLALFVEHRHISLSKSHDVAI